MSAGVYSRNLAKNAGILKFILRRMNVCPDPRVLLGPECRALDPALAGHDWVAVEAARAKLAALDCKAAACEAVRAHLPLTHGELPSIFHLAYEG
jgi:hypothetical protein